MPKFLSGSSCVIMMSFCSCFLCWGDRIEIGIHLFAVKPPNSKPTSVMYVCTYEDKELPPRHSPLMFASSLCYHCMDLFLTHRCDMPRYGLQLAKLYGRFLSVCLLACLSVLPSICLSAQGTNCSTPIFRAHALHIEGTGSLIVNHATLFSEPTLLFRV